MRLPSIALLAFARGRRRGLQRKPAVALFAFGRGAAAAAAAAACRASSPLYCGSCWRENAAIKHVKYRFKMLSY